MKAHLAKLSLALLSTVFLLGCQEQGSEPVGPEGPLFDKKGTGPCAPPEEQVHCHGDDDVDPEQSTLKLEFGMMATSLPVFVKERDNNLKVNNTDFPSPGIQMGFPQPSLFEARAGACTVIAGRNGGHNETLDDTEYESLLDELTAPVLSGFFVMQIDKTSLNTTSDDHGLLVQHDGTFFDGETGHTRIMLGGFSDHVDLVKVTFNEVTGVFTFTGPVVVWAHGVGGGGGKKSNRIIGCGGVDDNTVTATINQ